MRHAHVDAPNRSSSEAQMSVNCRRKRERLGMKIDQLESDTWHMSIEIDLQKCIICKRYPLLSAFNHFIMPNTVSNGHPIDHLWHIIVLFLLFYYFPNSFSKYSTPIIVSHSTHFVVNSYVYFSFFFAIPTWLEIILVPWLLTNYILRLKVSARESYLISNN